MLSLWQTDWRITLNADEIIKDEMTLDEKLAAIDAAMNDEQVKEDFNRRNGRPIDAPVDPAELTICEGCQ